MRRPGAPRARAGPGRPARGRRGAGRGGAGGSVAAAAIQGSGGLGACRTPEEVAAWWGRVGGAPDGALACAAVGRLARVSPRGACGPGGALAPAGGTEAAAAAAALWGAAVAGLAEAPPGKVAKAVAGAGQLGLPADEALLEALERAAAAGGLREAAPRELAQLLYGLGLLKASPGEAFWGPAEDALGARLGEFNAIDLSQLLYGYAALEQPAPVALLRGLEAAVGAQAPGMKPQGLSTVLWAWATLGYQPGDAALEAVREAATRSIHSFKHQDLAHLAWAHAKLGRRLPPPLLAGVLSRGAALADGCQARHLSLLVWSLARAGHRPPREFLERAAAALLAQQAAWLPLQVSQAAGGFAALAPADVDPALAGRLAAAFARHLGQKLREYRSWEMTSVLHSLAQLGRRPDDECLEKLVLRVRRDVDGCSLQSLAMLVCALAEFNYRPPQGLVDSIVLAVEEGREALEPVDLLNLLTGFEGLEVYLHPCVLALLGQELRDRRLDFPTEDQFLEGLESYLLLGGTWNADSAGREAGRTPKGGGAFRVDGGVRTTWKDFAK